MKMNERLQSEEFQLRVKQHAAVLDYVTCIENALREQRMTQQGLAGLLQKSRAWVSKVIRKKPNLTFFTAVEIADALGMDVRIHLEKRAPEERRLAG